MRFHVNHVFLALKCERAIDLGPVARSQNCVVISVDTKIVGPGTAKAKRQFEKALEKLRTPFDKTGFKIPVVGILRGSFCEATFSLMQS